MKHYHLSLRGVIDEAIQNIIKEKPGLLRYARNDKNSNGIYKWILS